MPILCSNIQEIFHFFLELEWHTTIFPLGADNFIKLYHYVNTNDMVIGYASAFNFKASGMRYQNA